MKFGKGKYKIFLVEDDESLCRLMMEGLVRFGYEVIRVRDFLRILEEFKEADCDLVIMDITLPYYNGYHWCTQIRTLSKLPIIFLSSVTERMNMIMALNMGADDYMTKPFDFDLLETKISALLRRAYDFRTEFNRIEHLGLVLDLQNMQLSYHGQVHELSKNEFRILEVLLRHVGQVVSREELMNKLWQSDVYIDDNTLTVNVSRIKGRLKELGLEEFILTKRGVGYYIHA